MNQKQEERLNQLLEYYKTIKDTENDSNSQQNEVIYGSKSKLLRFQTLIHLVLSARAKDSTTEQVVRELLKIKGGLTPDSLMNTPNSVLQTIVCKLPGWKRKLIYIKQIAEICASKYDNDIPKTREELMELPGVGVKISILAMDCCWNQNEGIGVDTHVHRVSNKLGFVRTQKPEQTEEELQKIIPKELWHDVNGSMYHLGQQICTSRKPKCAECPIIACSHHKKPKKQSRNQVEEEESYEEHSDIEDTLSNQ